MPIVEDSLDTETREVALVRIKKPVAMTLTKKPANRAGFKIIRSDKGETQKMTATHHDRKRRPKKEDKTDKNKKKKRADDSLYMIALPEGISEEEATSFRGQFGMEEDYDVVQETDGRFYLKRKNIANFEEMVAVPIDMGNGFIATIDSEVFEGSATRKDGQSGVRLVELQLDGYDLPAAKTWLEENEVDFREGGVEVVDGGVIVKRHDYNEADTRKVRIGEGVTGIVVRAADNDVPAHLYRAVIEESYGYYGYGLLDFSQFMAAPLYVDATWDGIYALREVLENVTLYSGLPLDERKVLVDNALTQYGNYYKALIDAMPRETLAAAQRFDKQQKEAIMPTPKKADDKVQTRTDDQVAADAAKAAADKAAQDAAKATGGDTAQARTDGQDIDETKFVTKDELGAVVKAAVTEALAARAETDAAAAKAAADGGAATDDGTPDKTEQRTDGQPSDADKKLAEGITTLADATAAMLKRMDQLDEKLDQYGEGVEARSDSGDGAGAAQDDTAPKTDVFAGMMGSLEGLRLPEAK